MVAKRWSSERIRRALSLLGGLNADQAYEFRAGKEDAIVSDTSIWRIVFSKRFRIGTAMLWVAFFTGNGMFYVLASWLPTVLKESGVPVSGAALYSSLFPLGGAVGAIVCGRLMDKVNPHTAVSAAWCLAGMFTFALASVIGDPGLLPFAIAAIGFMVGAGLVSIPTLAATFYPTQARASGVAWMAGFGRLGGIAGAYIGAIMLGAGLSGAEVIRALVAPAVIASIAIAMKGMSVNPLPAVAKA
jgi:AAHS family 4-hydroxybenzoate transporter-like MFS transporter